MRLLILTPALPYPPYQGGALRNYGLIHGLHAAGHDITLLSFDSSKTDVTATPLQSLCTRVETVPPPARSTVDRLRDLLRTSQPDLARRLMSDPFRQRLIDILSQTRFDLVQFEGLEMADYLPLVRQHQPTAKLCYDAHNAEYQLQQVIYEVDRSEPRRWPAAVYSYIQSGRIAHFERAVCQQVDGVLAVSEEDASALRSFRPDGQVAVIANGIFASDYSGHEKQLDLGSCVLTFTGKMDYRPNVDAMLWFTAEIFPLVQAQMPHVKLYIVGQKPHPHLDHLRDNEHIALTGWVPEIHPYLRATHVYIAPLRMGSGTRLKILEAMATGCAVSATTLAVAGLPPEARSALAIADSTTALAATIVALLQDHDEQRRLGVLAQTVVQKHYDWTVLIPRLLAAYQDMGLE